MWEHTHLLIVDKISMTSAEEIQEAEGRVKVLNDIQVP